jgi:hypothetical protein
MAVGAQVIVVRVKFRSTQTGSTSRTTYTDVPVWVPGGMGSGSAGHTEFRQTSHTSYSPYSYDTYDTRVVYMQQMERRWIGVQTARPAPDEAQRAGTNHGVVIHAVRRASPAYAANLLPGDILVKLNDHDVEPENWPALEISGEPIRQVTIMRQGEPKVVPLAIGADGSWPSSSAVDPLA